MAWKCYLLVSLKTGRTYVGCTTDAARRLRQHNGDLSGGGRYTSRGRPWRLAAVSKKTLRNRSEAQKFERFVKKGRGFQGRLKRLI